MHSYVWKFVIYVYKVIWDLVLFLKHYLGMSMYHWFYYSIHFPLPAFRFYVIDHCYAIHVSLRAPRYVMMGGSASLYCDYDVDEDQVHKVEWLRGEHKIYQYVRGRNPPYRNFSITGADIDVSIEYNKNQIDASHVTIQITIWIKKWINK